MLSLEDDPSGMNLVAANHCVLVHPMFTESPALAVSYEKQAIGRICRQGQVKPCFVYRFQTDGTIEESLFKAQRGERDEPACEDPEDDFDDEEEDGDSGSSGDEADLVDDEA
jgi:DNA repair and recombination RAD54-like protein